LIFASRAAWQSASAEPAASGAQHDLGLQVGDNLARGLLERLLKHRDLVGGAVRAGVARAQHRRQRLAAVVQIGQQRVKREAALEVDPGAFLLGARANERRVDVDHDPHRPHPKDPGSPDPDRASPPLAHPRQRAQELPRQLNAVSRLGQQRRPGVRDQPLPGRRDTYGEAAPSARHPQGDRQARASRGAAVNARSRLRTSCVAQRPPQMGLDGDDTKSPSLN
jgi:hypothetical protein